MRHSGLVTIGALVAVFSASGVVLAAPTAPAKAPAPAKTSAPAPAATAPAGAAATVSTAPAAPAPAPTTTTSATATTAKPGTKDAPAKPGAKDAKPGAKDAKPGASEASAGGAAAGASSAVPPPAAEPPPPPPVEEPPPPPPAPPPPPPPPPEPPPPPPEPEAPAIKKFAVEVGIGIGLDISTGALSVGPNPFLDVGARIHVGPGFLAFALRGGYQRYTATGSGTIACTATTTACITSNGGAYKWDLVEETVTIGLPISYRLLPEKRFHPYVGVQPQVFLQRATATSFGLQNSQGDTKFGFQGLLGGQFDVGPGGVFLEAGFQYASLEHRLTGKSNLGAVTLGLGYRLAF